MPYQPTSRYPSPWAGQPRAAAAATMTSGSAMDADGAVMIDGLEVVDEQVVVLSPLEPGGDHRPNRSARVRRYGQRGGRRGLG
jgi:hypothetical protein